MATDVFPPTFVARCIKSGMRETHCERCGCYLLTRGFADICPPCRQKGTMDHYPPCHVPLLKSTVGDPLTIDRVAFTLAEMLQEAGSNADKTSLVIGLCNAVSLCLSSMVEEPVATEKRRILLMFRGHLQAMSDSLGAFVRRPDEIAITGLTADEPYCVRCSWPKRLCICSVDSGMPHK